MLPTPQPLSQLIAVIYHKATARHRWHPVSHGRAGVGYLRVADEPNREALRFRRAFDAGNPIFIAEKTVDKHEKLNIPYSTAVVARDPDGDAENSGQHIIDTVSTEAVRQKDARELAYRLRDSNPRTFGLMRCKGIMRISQSSNMAFVFRVPEGYRLIRSMRDLLLTGAAPKSLTFRLQIARQLSMAVYYVHLYEFVHKNISPETILVFGELGEGDFGSFVSLIGFQSIRYVDGKTNTAGFGRQNSLYQYPMRQGQGGGSKKTVEYVMQHDMYSLGVCLLEVGL